MRILLLSTYFKPDIASTGVLMTYLAEDLAGLGHDVTVVTTFPHYDTSKIWESHRGKLFQQDKHSSVNVYRLYVYVPKRKDALPGRLLNYATFNALSVLVGTLIGKPDIVLAPSPPLTNGLSADIISRVRRIPFVYNVQDIYPDIAIRMEVMTNPRVIAFFRRIEQYIYHRATALAVISEDFRRNLVAKGVPPRKVKVIPNFIDTDFVRPLPRHNGFSSEQGLDDKFVVFFGGNVGFSQGLETVLEAAANLENQKDILFLIVGNGAAKPGLKNCAQKLNLENVRFLPFQPHEVVPYMYASSNVCLVPLRKGFAAESMPCKVYTITAAGRPLIASVDKDSDTHHFVQEAQCGLWVEPEDSDALTEAILDLCANEELREYLGRSGRQHVEAHYTRQAIAQRYDELLTKVVGMGCGRCG
jgi:colanic acid biosynthesis glycosyl transferase WcaI